MLKVKTIVYQLSELLIEESEKILSDYNVRLIFKDLTLFDSDQKSDIEWKKALDAFEENVGGVQMRLSDHLKSALRSFSDAPLQFLQELSRYSGLLTLKIVRKDLG